MSRLFDRLGQLSLVFGACSCLAARSDLSMVGRETGEGVYVFIVNF